MATLGTQCGYPSGIRKSGMSRNALVDKLRRLAWLTPDREFIRSYGEALYHLEQELRDKEVWLEQCNPDEWREHLEVYARILHAAHQVRVRVMRGEIRVGRKAAELLADWFSGYNAAMEHAMLTQQASRSGSGDNLRFHWMQ